MAIRDDQEFTLGDDTLLSLVATGIDLTGKRIELLVKPSSLSSEAEETLHLSTVGADPKITVTNAVSGAFDVDLTGLLATVGTSWYVVWVADVTDPDLDKDTFLQGLWAITALGYMVNTDQPCEPWPLDRSCWTVPTGGFDEVMVAGWQSFATSILWRLSGRRWGLCTQTVRPCGTTQLEQFVTTALVPGTLIPYLHGGVWRNATLCCDSPCEVRLPGPVHSITEVTIDGVILDPTAYRVDAPGTLVRQDGDCWPTSQDMGAVAGAADTFVVTYEIGLPVGNDAVLAVSEFAYEFIKACVPDCGDCRLPRRVTQIVRQNIAAQFIDPQTFLSEGRTGIYNVDLWLNSVNPNSLVAPPRVLSPDARPARRTLWTAP